MKAFNSIQQIINLRKQFSQFLSSLWYLHYVLCKKRDKDERMKGSIEIAFIFFFFLSPDTQWSMHGCHWMDVKRNFSTISFAHTRHFPPPPPSLTRRLAVQHFHVFMAFSPLTTMCGGNSSSCLWHSAAVKSGNFFFRLSKYLPFFSSLCHQLKFFEKYPFWSSHSFRIFLNIF